MVLPARALEQKEGEERPERTKDGEAEEEKVKEGAEVGPGPEELQHAAVVMPTSTDTGRFKFAGFLHLNGGLNDKYA